MAGILPSTPEAARAEIERLLVELLADVRCSWPRYLSIHQELLASDGLAADRAYDKWQLWTEVRVHGRLNGGPASAF